MVLDVVVVEESSTRSKMFCKKGCVIDWFSGLPSVFKFFQITNMHGCKLLPHAVGLAVLCI